MSFECLTHAYSCDATSGYCHPYGDGDSDVPSSESLCGPDYGGDCMPDCGPENDC